MSDLDKNISQESKQELKEKVRQRMKRREARSSSMNETLPVIGSESSIVRDLKNKAIRNYYERKSILNVPMSVLERHKDKHFVFLNYKRLEDSGFYNENGYIPFKVSSDSEDEKEFHKFGNRSNDGFVHRNEMILAYMPKEEYEKMKYEEKVVRGKITNEEVIRSNPDLNNEDISANIESKKVFVSGQS